MKFLSSRNIAMSDYELDSLNRMLRERGNGRNYYTRRLGAIDSSHQRFLGLVLSQWRGREGGRERGRERGYLGCLEGYVAGGDIILFSKSVELS